MADFLLIALPGAYHSSVGALTDSYMLVRDHVEQMFSKGQSTRMDTDLRVLSTDGAPVMLGDGSLIQVTGAIEDVPASFIWLPAFRAGGFDAMASRLASSRPLCEWLRRRASEGAIIGASGTAALLLMAAGLTTETKVPVARALRPMVTRFFPRQQLEERLSLVDSGNLLLAQGVANDLRLIVRVVERAISPAMSRWLTSVIGLDGVEEQPLATDALVARAQFWLEQHFTEAISIAALSAHLSTSQATLNRRFRKAMGMSPNAYVQKLRLEAAFAMLRKSERTVDQIAQLVGYSDARLFRSMFQRHTGMTATRWRSAARRRA